MAARKWTMTRLSESTLQKIAECRKSILIAFEQGKRDLYENSKGEISQDQIIAILADHFIQHKIRSRQ